MTSPRHQAGNEKANDGDGHPEHEGNKYFPR